MAVRTIVASTELYCSEMYAPVGVAVLMELRRGLIDPRPVRLPKPTRRPAVPW